MRRMALLLVALLPGAQALALEAPAQPEPLVPDADPVSLTFTAQVECSEALSSQEALTVAFEPSHEGLVATGPTSRALDRSQCSSGGPLTVAIPVEVAATRDLPAHETHALDVTVRLGDGPTANASLDVEAAFIATLAADVERAHRVAGPQEHMEFQVEVAAFANGITEVVFEADAPDEGDVVLPDPVVLDAGGGKASRINVTVVYATPFENGPNHASENLTIYAQAYDAKTEQPAGERVPIHLRADTDGFYVPGPAALLPVALALAWAARRRA